MKLLVITPTLGTSRWLHETIASVAAIGAPVRHVLVAPPQAMASLAEIAPGAERVNDGKTGVYGALNRGLAVGGEWDAFTWINDDDLLAAAGIAVALRNLERHPDIDVVFGRVALIDGRGGRVGGLPVARRGDDLAALLARGIVPLAQPGTVIRRGVWEKLGGFDESYRLAGDLDFFVRALATGARGAFVDAEVAAFRLSAGQLSKQRAVGEAEKSRALAPLAATPRSVAALWRFRAGNIGVYLERLRRHGWVSMQTIYDRTE